MSKASHSGSLGKKNKGDHGQLLIGKNFEFSPIGNHNHPGVEKSYERGRVFAKTYAKTLNTSESCRVAGLPMTKKGNPQGRPKEKYDYLVEKELKKMGEIAKSKGITPELVIEELMGIAFNSEGVFEGNEKIKITADHKLKALDMLAKYLGLYERDNKQKVADTKVLQVAFVGADYVAQRVEAAEKTRLIKDDSIVKKNEKSLGPLDDEILNKMGLDKDVLKKGN